MIDVSIVIPAFNAAAVIGRAIQSGLSQSGVSVEIIVADDASLDDTRQVVESVRDSRVKYLRQTVNSGPAAARNLAIEAATGAWIAVLDADDMLLPGRLAAMRAAAVAQDAAIVTDNMWIEDALGARRLFVDEPLDGGFEPMDLAHYASRNRLFGKVQGDGYLKPLFSGAFLRESGLRYDARLRIGEDFMLVAEAMALGARYGRLRSAGYVYTTHAGSISHRLRHADAIAMVRADERFLERHAARLSSDERQAMMTHLHSLQDGAGFVAMVDSIKARDFAGLARHVRRHPAAVRHFAMPLRARIARLTG